MKKIIITIYTILPIVAATLLLTSCGSNTGDNTVENWFMAILLMLCWLKGFGK